MKDRALLWLSRLIGLLALAVFVIVKSPGDALMERTCRHYVGYGDLYRDAMVPRFKVPQPAPVGPPLSRSPSAEAARDRVFVMGDSFMPFRDGHEAYARALAARLGRPVYFEGWDVPSPTCVFSRLHAPVDRRVRRVVVLESVERIVVERLAAPAPCPPWMPEEHRATRSPAAFAARLFALAFEDREQRFRGFLYYNALTLPLVEAFCAARFELFGIIGDQTPVYSLNPPFLFLRSETDPDLPSSYYARHDDALIERLADVVARMRDELQARANADLVFMPVPSKYTIYHRLLNDDPYDRFLPRLCDAVERRGVATVRLYERFAAEPRLTYYPTDAHWTPLGIEIALGATMDALTRLGWGPGGRAP